MDIWEGVNFLCYSEATDIVKEVIEKMLLKNLPKLCELMEEPIDILRTQLQGVLEEQQRTVAHRAQCAVNFPTQGMVADEEEWKLRGKLVEDICLFFKECN